MHLAQFINPSIMTTFLLLSTYQWVFEELTSVVSEETFYSVFVIKALKVVNTCLAPASGCQWNWILVSFWPPSLFNIGSKLFSIFMLAISLKWGQLLAVHTGIWVNRTSFRAIFYICFNYSGYMPQVRAHMCQSISITMQNPLLWSTKSSQKIICFE